MKILLINGSPRKNGNTFVALSEIAKTLQEEGFEAEIAWIGINAMRGCIACARCKSGEPFPDGHKGCAFNDDNCNAISAKFAEADAFVFGSPVYYGMPNGTVLSFMQRLFYSCGCNLHMKVGASVVSCRRGGNSATFAIMNQFFGINGMPTVPSTYWNDVHGYKGEDVLTDVEGTETVRNMATNMAFLIKSIQAGKEQFGKPDVKHTQFFNFIR